MKFKIDFQDDSHGVHLGFLIRMTSDIFDLQVTLILRTYKVTSVGLLVQEKRIKINIQHGGYGDHLGFLIRTILAILDLQVTLILTIASSQLAFSSEEVKIDYKDDDSRKSWISYQNNFSYFRSTSLSYKIFSQLAFQFRKEIQNRFSR